MNRYSKRNETKTIGPHVDGFGPVRKSMAWQSALGNIVVKRRRDVRDRYFGRRSVSDLLFLPEIFNRGMRCLRNYLRLVYALVWPVLCCCPPAGLDLRQTRLPCKICLKILRPARLITP